jgi:hypothetical protein
MILEATEDGFSWTPCPVAGKYWHCPFCEVGVLMGITQKCPNCHAGIRAKEMGSKGEYYENKS